MVFMTKTPCCCIQVEVASHLVAAQVQQAQLHPLVLLVVSSSPKSHLCMLFDDYLLPRIRKPMSILRLHVYKQL